MAEEPVADDAVISGKSNCDYVIEILQATNDGHDLYQTADEIARHGRNGDGQWLLYLQNAANGWLSGEALRMLPIFHQHVLAGDYKYPILDFFEKFVKGKP